MAVRFVIGRAGSGKTHHCLCAIQALLRQDSLGGPKLILLVPEQAALQAERSILEPNDIPAMHRAEVLSFRRLAFKVFDSVGGATRRALSEPARAMVLRHLLIRNAAHLQYYRRMGRLGGFVDRLGATIAELIQEAVAPDDLAAVCRGTDFVDSIQPAKLHDVALIYRAYVEYLGTERSDPTQNLEIARAHLDECRWLYGSLVWVDGFASLSRQEALTLVALARICSSMDITLLMEPTFADLDHKTGIDPRVAQLFGKTARTYADLRRLFVEGGMEIDDPLVLRPTVPPRFAGNEVLTRLEQFVFRNGARAAGFSPRGRSERVESSDLESITCGGTAQAEARGSGWIGRSPVELVELPTRRLEVEYAVSRVVEWVRDPAGGLRYSDLAIIVRDHTPYHDLLSEALSARGIPFFIDRRRSIAHHPLVELLRAGAALAADPLALEPVRFLLKTGLLSLSDAVADELENYLLAQNISGSEAWRGDDWQPTSAPLTDRDKKPTEQEVEQLRRINATRRAFLDLVDDWPAFAGASTGHSGEEWAEAIAHWLERMKVGEVLSQWTATAEADGDIDAAAEHRQVWRDTMAFLDDLAFAFAAVPLNVEEFAEVLESGLAGMTLALAPPMVDALLVGSIERSRHPDIKAAVVMGFNDGIFPARITEDPVLNDDDRDLMRDAGLGVAPASRQATVDEALLVYITFTRASEHLVVTYSAADEQGTPLHISRCAGALRQALDGWKGGHGQSGPALIERSLADPMSSRDTWDVLSHRDLTRRITAEFRNRPAVERDDTDRRARWNELYDSVRLSLIEEPPARWALSSLKPQPEAKLSPESIARLTGEVFTASVSLLETFAACPFQYFGKYGLRLRERELAKLKPVDIGQAHHAILEDFVRGLADRHIGFAELDEARLEEELGQCCRRVMERLPEGGAFSDARNAYLMARSNRALARVLHAQRRLAKAGIARPAAVEVAFGSDDPGSLPALEMTTPSGRHIRLRGYIDRVDIAELSDELLGIVIDYKRTRDKKLSLTRAYHGLSLQLPGYLLALAERGESLTGRPIRPIAALYVSLMEHYQSVDHPDAHNARETALQGTYRTRGLILEDKLEALDNAAGAGWSEHFSVYRKRDGMLGYPDRNDAVDRESFDLVLNHTRRKLGELADAILDGDVAVRPYRLKDFSPCSWCPLDAVCRMETGLSELRFLENLTRSGVFRNLTDKADSFRAPSASAG